MCIFITLITKASEKGLVSDILIKAGRRAELIDNSSLRAAIAPDEIQLLTTNGHCDCDTVLGYGPVENAKRNFDDEIRKLKRKKWSQTKIERYIEDRLKADDKNSKSRLELASDSFDLWRDIITITQMRGATSIALFYTMYSEGVAKERIQPIVKKANLSEEALRTLSENEILYFT